MEMPWFSYSDSFKILVFPKGERRLEGYFFRTVDNTVEIHDIHPLDIKSTEPITEKDIHIARLYVQFNSFMTLRYVKISFSIESKEEKGV